MERYERNIIIPIKIEGDKVVCVDGQPLPKFSHGTFGDLVISSIFLQDKEDQKKFSQEERTLAFKNGEELYFEMNSKFITQAIKNESYLMKMGPKYFVKILLEEDLFLKARFQKKAKFVSCKCYIPCLDKTADSLNHAYTLISQKFESTRRSHTGNVFNICYFQNIGNLEMLELEIKRKELFT